MKNNRGLKKQWGAKHFFEKSIGNKIYSIVGLMAIVVLFIVLLSLYTSTTLSMVTSFSRMERGHSVALSDAKTNFYKFMVLNDTTFLGDYKKYIYIAHAYSQTFGGIKDLIRNKPHNVAVDSLAKVFKEIDLKEADKIVTRVNLLLWNPVVQKLIKIAQDAHQVTSEYEIEVTKITQASNKKERAAALINLTEIEKEA